MSDTPETPNPPADDKKSRHKEYEDPHYHDDDELPADDAAPGHRPAPRKPTNRRPPPRRPRYED